MKDKNKHFSGYFTVTKSEKVKDIFSDNMITVYTDEDFYMERVLYNDPVTIVFWSDGTKTVAKCHGGDIYSPEMGLTICIMKKLVGGKTIRELFNDWLPEIPAGSIPNGYKNINVGVKDVRRKHKED